MTARPLNGAPSELDPSILAIIEEATSGSSPAWRQLAALVRESIATTNPTDAN